MQHQHRLMWSPLYPIQWPKQSNLLPRWRLLGLRPQITDVERYSSSIRRYFPDFPGLNSVVNTSGLLPVQRLRLCLQRHAFIALSAVPEAVLLYSSTNRGFPRWFLLKKKKAWLKSVRSKKKLINDLMVYTLSCLDARTQFSIFLSSMHRNLLIDLLCPNQFLLRR